jgi:multidrug efflux system outer membrane protein
LADTLERTETQENRPKAEQDQRQSKPNDPQPGNQVENRPALAYRGTVLNALQEVEDALVAYRTDQAARDKAVEAVKSGDLAFYLAQDRYSHGLADFLQVLDAERTLVGSRQQLVQADLALTNDVVALYNALGGGWQEDVAASQAPVIATTSPITPAALDSLAPVQPVNLRPKQFLP